MLCVVYYEFNFNSKRKDLKKNSQESTINLMYTFVCKYGKIKGRFNGRLAKICRRSLELNIVLGPLNYSICMTKLYFSTFLYVRFLTHIIYNLFIEIIIISKKKIKYKIKVQKMSEIYNQYGVSLDPQLIFYHAD